MELHSTERMASSRRRQLLIEAGIVIAREEGGRAVSLARVAERCGVSKPIAYRHFGTLAALLEEMQRHVVGGYESAVTEAMGDARLVHSDAVAVIAKAYIEHSVGDGAVYEAISAARVALEGATEETFVLPERYVELVTETFGMPREAAVPLLVMFLGAADNLVAAVHAGAIAPTQAVDHLTGLFTAGLVSSVGTR